LDCHQGKQYLHWPNPDGSNLFLTLASSLPFGQQGLAASPFVIQDIEIKSHQTENRFRPMPKDKNVELSVATMML